MAVLPNRFLVKLDTNNDYFKTYLPHLGLLRLTVGKATAIDHPEKKKGGIKGGMSRLMAKVKLEDTPDCYVNVKVGAEEEWKTSVVDNNHEPVWNETHDFLVTDFEQQIVTDVQDDDLAGDDDIGIASTTVKEILLKGGSHELALSHKGERTGATLTVHAQFYHFVSDANALSTAASQNQGKDLKCGLATILIASALGLQGNRDELQPSVKVTFGDKSFQTAVKTYTPGTDIFNPAFDQAFRIPLTAEMLANPGNFRISLMNKTEEAGSAEVGFQNVVGAEGMSVADSFDVGGGAAVRASIHVRGAQLAE
jgi:Ca2+-dependent lipid-binding protein